IRPLGPAKIGAEIEEIVLHAGQRSANAFIGDMQQSDANDCVRLVDAAISFDAGVEFRQACAVAERRAPVVAGARVYTIEFHEFSRPCGRVDCPYPRVRRYQRSRKRARSPAILPLTLRAGAA